jgi:hypothetical protein
MRERRDAPLLHRVLPELATELRDSLARQGEPDLSAQINELEIKSLCGCDDDFCGSFYTGDLPSGPWFNLGEHYSLPVETDWLVVLMWSTGRLGMSRSSIDQI